MKRSDALPELLAPAGSRAAFDAAVSAGADAVYLGGPGFNARAYAANFDWASLRSATADAHAAGVRVYLTLNTLVFDRELRDYLLAAETAADAGADALIVADIGGASAIGRTFPEIPLHASTQMTVHCTESARVLAGMGFRRAVLARELCRDDIRSFTANAPLEAEVFIHGALCVCHSGQCLFSSMVGGRSGNRGECAQPCRLPYSTSNGRGHPLSLKDLCLAGHVTELIDDGVSSLKIEGRMKPAEYVRAVTSVWRRLLDEGRNATPDELRYLSGVFSRSGFTDAYYTGKLSPSMLGVRTVEDKKKSASSAAPETQEGKRAARAPVPVPYSCRAHASDYRPARPVLRPAPLRYAEFLEPRQITPSALGAFDMIFVPLERFGEAVAAGLSPKGVSLPPVITDSGMPEVRQMLRSAAAAGATDALVAGLGQIALAKEAGLTPHGGFRLNVTNGESAAAYERLGISDYVPSPELTLPRIRDLGGRPVPMIYGRIPLMLTEKCVGLECGGCRTCGKHSLTDRMRKVFPVRRAWRHRSLILNSVTLYMADQPQALSAAHIGGGFSLFTTETPAEVDAVIRASAAHLPFPLSGEYRRIARK